jgi:hypothetical protein
MNTGDMVHANIRIWDPVQCIQTHQEILGEIYYTWHGGGKCMSYKAEVIACTFSPDWGGRAPM